MTERRIVSAPRNDEKNLYGLHLKHSLQRLHSRSSVVIIINETKATTAVAAASINRRELQVVIVTCCRSVVSLKTNDELQLNTSVASSRERRKTTKAEREKEEKIRRSQGRFFCSPPPTPPKSKSINYSTQQQQPSRIDVRTLLAAPPIAVGRRVRVTRTDPVTALLPHSRVVWLRESRLYPYTPPLRRPPLNERQNNHHHHHCSCPEQTRAVGPQMIVSVATAADDRRQAGTVNQHLLDSCRRHHRSGADLRELLQLDWRWWSIIEPETAKKIETVVDKRQKSGLFRSRRLKHRLRVIGGQEEPSHTLPPPQ